MGVAPSRAATGKRRRVIIGLALLVAAALVPVVYWWPGRGALTYFGISIPSPFAESGPPRFALAQPRDDLPGLPNFAQVSSALYRGAQPSHEGFAELRRRGIKTVVSLRDLHSDRELLEGLGLRYVRLDFNATEPSDELVAAFLRVVTDPANQPVFVHCQAGADRTGTMVAAYRTVVEGWKPEEAALELPHFGFHEVWTDLQRYLARLDASAIERLMASQPPPPVEVVP